MIFQGYFRGKTSLGGLWTWVTGGNFGENYPKWHLSPQSLGTSCLGRVQLPFVAFFVRSTKPECTPRIGNKPILLVGLCPTYPCTRVHGPIFGSCDRNILPDNLLALILLTKKCRNCVVHIRYVPSNPLV